MEISDQELLQTFVKNRSEDAFRQMVNRHLNLVFATARRIVGDPHLAEEVSQGVFVLLARKAGEIRSNQPLAGWLYHTSRNQSLNASRSEGRRRQREQSAIAMQTTESGPDPKLITAELEDAMDELPPDDRDALVLRFLDNRQLREVGTELGISEEAARKRVSRALEKLRGIFGKRGIAMSAGLLATTLTSQAATAAPAALGLAITTAALSQIAAVSTVTIATINTTSTMTTLFNLKTAAVVLGVAAATGTSTYLVKEKEADRLRADNQTLNQNYADSTAQQQEAKTAIRLRDDQIARLKKDIADLPRLRGEIDSLNRKLSDTDRLIAKLKASNSELESTLSAMNAAIPAAAGASDNEPDPGMLEAKAEFRGIQAAAEQFRLEYGGRMPGKVEDLSVFLGSAFLEKHGGLDRYEFHDFSSLSQDQLRQLHKDTIVITEREARRTSSGEYFKAYYLADGSVEVVKGGGTIGAPGQPDIMVRHAPDR